MKNKRIPTIVGVLVLLIGVAVGVFVVATSENLSIFTKAGPTAVPRQVELTNIDSDMATVSWVSDTNVSGFVKYGDKVGELTKVTADDRDQLSGTTELYTTHYVTLKNLEANTTYYFEIGSGSVTYDNNGKPYSFKTPAGWTKPADDTVSGKVVLGSGQPVPGAIVYLDLEGGVRRSALSRSSGVWTVPLSTTRTADLSGYLPYDRENAAVKIMVTAGDIGTAVATVNTSNDSPVPDIVMGETNEFATPSAALAESFEASPGGGLITGLGLNEATVSTNSSSFSQITFEPINEEYEATLSVKLVSDIDQGEKIATSTPEFKVSAPPGQKVKITVRSDPQSTELVAGADGEVDWSPPEGLEPGVHNLEIEYVDENGVLQKINRSFTVLADEPSVGAGGLPSFSSTPSAKISPTVAATIPKTPTASSSSRVSMPSTASGVPQPGTFGPTIAVLLVGILLFIGGVVFQLIARKRYI